ncbi:helix-turn-helix transcriptional regulator [Nocardia sp. NBC_00565]|uniref:helix-turn-helix domain-containing protein n=1 Tax=Nocardia sp. NBC_00565 TaxID=2975993 RepID=UPI002E7FD16B|nr:helix-turn-helix transcriptional regulator [Nocardia sp. NBC_00565]WUC03775.1 helix-turn-helix transcriptional regulator [Nocardia sp. NBC_00565]
MTRTDAGNGVAERVRQARKLKGWTQERLAQEVAAAVGKEARVSLSLIRGVERGAVQASPTFLSAVSKTLGTSVPELLGQPYAHTSTEDSEVATGIAVIRRELAAYDLPNSITPRPIELITADVDQLRGYRRATNFRKLSAALPAVLPEARALAHSSKGRTRELAFGLLCDLYSASWSLAHKLGYADLATIAVERLSWAANLSGDQLWIAAAQFQRASVLTSVGDWDAAQTYLDVCRAALDVKTDDRRSLVSWGGLHLQSGLAAARAGDRQTSDAHLAEARETVARIGDNEFQDPVLVFGHSNVGIWSVGLAVEMLDGVEAIRRAGQMQIVPGTPRSRVGHLYIDLGRAYLLNGDRKRTLESLQQAREIAPSQTRYHPMVHETVRVLARREARSTESLRGFAAWCGVTSLD